MRLLEYDAKQIFHVHASGIHVPKSKLIDHSNDVTFIQSTIADHVVLKAQVNVVDHGKAGGVLYATKVTLLKYIGIPVAWKLSQIPNMIQDLI